MKRHYLFIAYLLFCLFSCQEAPKENIDEKAPPVVAPKQDSTMSM